MEQEKFSWKEMTWKQRGQYFMDYYFKITVVILIILCMVLSFVKTVFFDKTETKLSVIVINDSSMEFDQETMEEELRQRMGWTEENQEISFTFLTTGSYENEVVLVTRLRAEAVDMIISDRGTFDQYVKNGFFDEAEKYIPKGMDLSEYLVTGRVEEIDDRGEVISQGEELAYGFDLRASEKYKELGGILEDPVIGVVVNGENRDAADEVIAYLME